MCKYWGTVLMNPRRSYVACFINGKSRNNCAIRNFSPKLGKWRHLLLIPPPTMWQSLVTSRLTAVWDRRGVDVGVTYLSDVLVGERLGWDDVLSQSCFSSDSFKMLGLNSNAVCVTLARRSVFHRNDSRFSRSSHYERSVLHIKNTAHFASSWIFRLFWANCIAGLSRNILEAT